MLPFQMLKEYKGSRFKVFNSEIEAHEFSTSTQPFQQTQVQTLNLQTLRDYEFKKKEVF